MIHVVLNTRYSLRHCWLIGDMISAETLTESPDTRLRSGVSATYDSEGHMLITRVSGEIGYYYDNPSVSDWLIAGVPVVAASCLVSAVLAFAYYVCWRGARRELALIDSLESASEPEN